MTPLTDGDVDCQSVLTLTADSLNITYACKLLVKILRQYFNAFMKKNSVLL